MELGSSRTAARIRPVPRAAAATAVVGRRRADRVGARAFEFLLALLEADGSLVSKKDLLDRVWPDTVVVEQNLKVQVSALRRALGEDRDFIRTEFGRGYRFTAAVRSTGQIARRSTSRECPVSAFPSLQLPQRMAQIDLRPHPTAH